MCFAVGVSYLFSRTNYLIQTHIRQSGAHSVSWVWEFLWVSSFPPSACAALHKQEKKTIGWREEREKEIESRGVRRRKIIRPNNFVRRRRLLLVVYIFFLSLLLLLLLLLWSYYFFSRGLNIHIECEEWEAHTKAAAPQTTRRESLKRESKSHRVEVAA